MCASVIAGKVEDIEEASWCTREFGYGAREVGYGAREVSNATNELLTATDGLPTTVDGLLTSADGLPSSLRFGDGECGGVDEVVSAGDEDPDIDEDAPCAPSAPPAHAYSTMKSQSMATDPSSTALSHA